MVFSIVTELFVQLATMSDFRMLAIIPNPPPGPPPSACGKSMQTESSLVVATGWGAGGLGAVHMVACINISFLFMAK